MINNRFRHIGLLIVRICVGMIFVISGVSKLTDLLTFSEVIQKLNVIPIEAVSFMAIGVSSCETIFGLLFASGVFVRTSGLCIIALLVVFLAVIIQHRSKKNNIVRVTI